MKRSPRSTITVDLAAVRANVAALRGRLRPGARFLAAVKADAYGHGLWPVGRAVLDAGADGLAVATAEEAVRLRDAGHRGHILVMGPLYGVDQYLEMARQDVEVAVVSEDMARELAEFTRAGVSLRIHLKVDSGMNRQGILPAYAGRFLDVIAPVRELELVGVMTHFACTSEDPASVDFQLGRFLPVVEQVRARYPGIVAHAANSAATVCCPQAHLDMVRCGIAVYGLSPFGGDALAEGLYPALRWTSVVALVRQVAAGEGVGYGHTWRPERDTLVAVIPVGYADGVFRILSNRGSVLIGGRRYPMVGRVSMDSFGVDLGPESVVRAGERVTLIGADGRERVSAEEVAAHAETINYEITCAISLDRAERVFVNEESGGPATLNERAAEGFVEGAVEAVNREIR